LKVILVERGEPVDLDQANGRFSIGNLTAGSYTLKAIDGDDDLGHMTFDVPGPEFEFKI
jgi:hypothetical protein